MWCSGFGVWQILVLGGLGVLVCLLWFAFGWCLAWWLFCFCVLVLCCFDFVVIYLVCGLFCWLIDLVGFRFVGLRYIIFGGLIL